MTVHELAVRAAACLAALTVVGIAPVSAKQPCSTEAGKQGYWSWRMIDDRKCWYEGKPGLSKALLEWPAAETPAQADNRATPTRDVPASDAPANDAPAIGAPATGAPEMRVPAMRRDPMNARAQVRDDAGTFEALWRARIENK